MPYPYRFNYRRLDAATRAKMFEEIELARTQGQLYYSTRFNEVGKEGWPGWLLTAAQSHDEHWLAWTLEQTNSMKDFEYRDKPLGGYTVAHVPQTASETLADGQFTRFYNAAVCRLAIEAGKQVTVYRAKIRGEPRPESQALVGRGYDAKALLAEMRSRDASLRGELLKPNSGLAVDF